MQITPAALDAIFYTINTLFQGAYSTTPNFWNRVAMLAPSAGRENRYGWLRALPAMREWIGERVYRNLEASSYTLVNRDFELTLALKRNEIEDDLIGMYNSYIQMMGAQAAKWPDDLVRTVMQEGNTRLCFDGQPFFSASHPTFAPAGGTYQNWFASGTALSSANYQLLRQTMMSYVDEAGRPMGITPNLLVVPPQLEATGRQILNADFTAPAAALGQNAASIQQTNVLKGSAELLVLPELTNQATRWYLLDNTKPVKPFVFQQRKAPTSVALTDPQSENLFRRKEYVYGVDSRGEAGYSLPFLCAAAQA